MKLLVIFFCMILFLLSSVRLVFADSNEHWKIQSIDTMKYSRDMAREALKSSEFDQVIEQQTKEIKETGANYIAIGTPYDEEFLPVLKLWIQAARKENLHVWFRGNLSGWEGWFEYKKITPTQHTKMIKEFILDNSDLFVDGDIFSTCPECENGAIGDPRSTKKVTAYRQFLIKEYETAKEAFFEIDKQVDPGYFSMNGDVANLVMDRETTEDLGNRVVIDHYVKSPEQMAKDIKAIAQKSRGQVILGEFGAPIPDIHGNMSESQQAKWLEQTLQEISWVPVLVGLNYWTSVGGSTQLWSDEGKARQAQTVLEKFYLSRVFTGTVKNEVGMPVGGVLVSAKGVSTMTDDAGEFALPYLPKDQNIVFESKEYFKQTKKTNGNQTVQVTLSKKSESRWYHLIKILQTILEKLPGN